MQVPIVEQISKSNFARRATLQMGNKLLTLPTYGGFIHKKIDFNTILNSNVQGYNHFDMICSPIHALRKIIEEKEQRKDLINQFGDPVEKDYLELRKKVWFMDTYCNNLYYSSFDDKLKDFPGYSIEVRKFLGTFTKENYTAKFKELKEDTKLYMKYIKETVDEQISLRMDFIMPPSPIVFNTSPKYIINIIFDIIRTVSILAETKAEKPSAIYLTIHSNNFKNPQILNSLLETLFNEATEEHIAKMKFVVVKIIDEESIENQTAGMRIRYKDFITNLSMFCSNTKRTLILLDSNSLGLTSIALGVDSFIEPLNGVPDIAFRRPRDKHGRYYHPEGLKFEPYQDMKEVYTNKGTLPCHCKFCSSIKVKHLDLIPTGQWNILRRSHLVASRSSEIVESHEAIEKDIISNAITDKIQRSDVKNYLDFLPK